MAATNTELVGSLFRRYRRQLQNFLTARLHPQDVEDVAQRTYLQLLQHPAPGDIRNPQAYLFRTASNLAIDSLRRDGTRARHAAPGIEADEVADRQAGLDRVVDQELQFRRFVAALDELPERCRHAFILHRLEGWSHAEVAERLGVSRKTVQRYVLRALAHCQEVFGEP